MSVESDDDVNRPARAKTKQQAAREWLIVRVLCNRLTVPHNIKDSVPVNVPLKHSLNGVAAEDYPATVHNATF